MLLFFRITLEYRAQNSEHTTGPIAQRSTQSCRVLHPAFCFLTKLVFREDTVGIDDQVALIRAGSHHTLDDQDLKLLEQVLALEA